MFVRNQNPSEYAPLFSFSSVLEFDTSSRLSKSLGRNSLEFCCRAIIQTIECLKNYEYAKFDAFTTTTCCHGVSLLTLRYIQQALKYDLRELLVQGHSIALLLENSRNSEQLPPLYWELPESIIELSRLYITCLIREIDPNSWRGLNCVLENLQCLGQISKKKSSKIINKIRTWISNSTVHLYSEDTILPSKWMKYLSEKYVRTDNQGRKYVSNLFSMQHVISHLKKSRTPIVLLNDVRDTENNHTHRLSFFIRGNSEDQWEELSYTSGAYPVSEPVVVFGGCTYQDNPDLNSLHSRMKKWLSKFSKLVLACDTHYPQFPAVHSDPNFDNSPIFPEEIEISSEISSLSQTGGVSVCDPSFFCLVHIYTCSMQEVLPIFTENSLSALSPLFIANHIRSKCAPGASKSSNNQ